LLLNLRELPTETNVERGTSRSKSGSFPNLDINGFRVAMPLVVVLLAATLLLVLYDSQA
jgi:hypothetical protein